MNRREVSLGLAASAAALPAAAQVRGRTSMIELSAGEAVAAMKTGAFTAEAYANALLAQCEAKKGLNAFITLEPDKVREAARAADRLRAAGGKLGPLHGLPIPVKDSVNTAEYPTTAGTNALRNHRPVRDATVIARLKAAGASVLGKTNLHELSYGWTSSNTAFGAVHNPYDPTRIPGGSSGGTAAAVAARMAPLGLAEDTQGSIRVPAALCGVAGFRPTLGRYPSEGTAPITPLFDQVGPHARRVADLALFDAAVTGDARLIAAARLKGVKIGVVRGFYFANLDPEVERVANDVLVRLRAEGVEVIEGELPGVQDLISKVTGTAQSHDIASAFAGWLKDSGGTVSLDAVIAAASPDVRGGIQRSAQGFTPEAEANYVAARDVHRPAMQKLFADFFRDKGVSAILFPATMTTAPSIGQTGQITYSNGGTVSFTQAVSRNITPGSTSGLPGLVLPAGLSRANLPVSIELDGPAGSDRELLALGLAVESVLGHLPAPR